MANQRAATVQRGFSGENAIPFARDSLAWHRDDRCSFDRSGSSSAACASGPEARTPCRLFRRRRCARRQLFGAMPTHFDWPLPHSAGWSAGNSSAVDPGTGVEAIGLGGQFDRRMGWYRHRIARGLGLQAFRGFSSATRSLTRMRFPRKPTFLVFKFNERRG
jgi:hypothetical protein